MKTLLTTLISFITLSACAQNVGIGTTQPNHKLDISGDSYSNDTSGKIEYGIYTDPYSYHKTFSARETSGSRWFVHTLRTVGSDDRADNENVMYIVDSITGNGSGLSAGWDTSRMGYYVNLFVDNSSNFRAPQIWMSNRQPFGIQLGTNPFSFFLDSLGFVNIVDGTQGLGKVLTSDANGEASWQSNIQALDSVHIYALSPSQGNTYYCNDCHGNPPNYLIGGLVSYTGSLWRRNF